MTNILFILSDLEIKNKQVIEEKDRSVQILQGTLEKQQNLKVKLYDMNSENSQILTEFQATIQKINNMENIRIERDSLQVTLQETDAYVGV